MRLAESTKIGKDGLHQVLTSIPFSNRGGGTTRSGEGRRKKIQRWVFGLTYQQRGKYQYLLNKMKGRNVSPGTREKNKE